MATAAEICKTLGGAVVSATKVSNQVMFLHTGHHANVRKHHEYESTKSIIAKIAEGKIQTSHVPAIMAACLRTRFLLLEDAVPAVRLATL